MKVYYESNDGKTFNTQKECEAYESKNNYKKEFEIFMKKMEDVATREAKELKDLEEKYDKEIEKLNKEMENLRAKYPNVDFEKKISDKVTTEIISAFFK